MKRLIVTADDFGLAPEVNQAVELACREGVLSAASLMVGGPAAADAVDRARRLPRLAVGLHLCLVDAAPVLAPSQIPRLVDGRGRLRSDMTRLAFELAFHASARKQMRAEIEAQFAAFEATGLPLDHVNAHRHFHVHPLVSDMVLEIGARRGMKAIRIPYEPAALIGAAETCVRREARPLETAFALRLRQRARAAGLDFTQGALGLRWSGGFTKRRWLGVLAALPEGAWELFCHPATSSTFAGAAPGYGYEEELAALVDPDVRRALTASGALVGGFTQCPAGQAASAENPARFVLTSGTEAGGRGLSGDSL